MSSKTPGRSATHLPASIVETDFRPEIVGNMMSIWSSENTFWCTWCHEKCCQLKVCDTLSIFVTYSDQFCRHRFVSLRVKIKTKNQENVPILCASQSLNEIEQSRSSTWFRLHRQRDFRSCEIWTPGACSRGNDYFSEYNCWFTVIVDEKISGDWSDVGLERCVGKGKEVCSSWIVARRSPTIFIPARNLCHFWTKISWFWVCLVITWITMMSDSDIKLVYTVNYEHLQSGFLLKQVWIFMLATGIGIVYSCEKHACSSSESRSMHSRYLVCRKTIVDFLHRMWFAYCIYTYTVDHPTYVFDIFGAVRLPQ